MILSSRPVSPLSLRGEELIVGDLKFACGQYPLPPGEELIVGDLKFAPGQSPLPLGEG